MTRYCIALVFVLGLTATAASLTTGCDDTATNGNGACTGSNCSDLTGDRVRPPSDAGDSSDADTEDTPISSDAGDASSDMGDVTVVTDLGGVRGGGLMPDPASIFFSSAGVGSFHEQIVRVYNNTDETVTFTSAEVVSATPGFALREAPVNEVRNSGQAIGFALEYRAESEGDAIAEILVHNSFSDAVIIPVTVASKAEDDACISVSPTSLSFGPIVRGAGTETQTFTIENCGTHTIGVIRLDRGRLLGFVPTPTTFQWTSPETLPFTLEDGESVDVPVTFSPGRAGTDRGAVEVVSNVDGSETIRVNLSGVTQAPPLSELDVHLRLNWTHDGPSDVDFHFYPETSELFSCDDCFYSNMSPDWGTAGDIVDDPFLDVDDLVGPGPENINVDELPAGTYIIAVHYYSDTGSGGSDSDFPTDADATVEVFLGGVLAQTYGPVNLDSTDRTWNVARLEWPSGTLTTLGDTFVVNRGDYDWCSSF